MASASVPLLYIVGGDDPDEIRTLGSKVRFAGSSDLTMLLMKRQPHHRLHVTRNYLRQARRPDLSHYRCILNLITEPERNPRSLEILRKLLRGVPGKVVNRPEAVLRSTREQVARLIDGISGLRVPTTVRLAAGKAAVAERALETAGVEPPLILRKAGTHGGRFVGRFDRIDELVAALDPQADHLASQFVDFRGPDGLYRKYRVFFIGTRMVLRHRLVSDHWNVHANDRTRFMAERPELIAEERALFEPGAKPFPPVIGKTLQAVRERMPLDFFGVDFAVTGEGEVLLFEANATMSFFPLSPDPRFTYLRRCFEPARRAFRELLELPEEQSPINHPF